MRKGKLKTASALKGTKVQLRLQPAQKAVLISRFRELLQKKVHSRALLYIVRDETSRKTEIDLMARAAGQL
jgi:hypothetical protein